MGLKLGMDKQAVMSLTFGEFMDLIACDSISKGNAVQKRKPKKMDFDEFMALR